MPLLAEYAITPDVFDVDSYTNKEVCGAHLGNIQGPMLTAGLVRDLRDGEWHRLFTNNDRTWHRRGKELIKELAKQGRLTPSPPVLPDSPPDDQGWCAEALATHNNRAFTGGVIVTESIKNVRARVSLVAQIDQLENAQWWTPQNSSVTLTRKSADYKRHLDQVLRYSNSLLFIDPYLDPMKPRYRHIGALLKIAGRQKPPPKIEIHRHSHEGRANKNNTYFENRFRTGFMNTLHAAGLQVEVFIWDRFHDRYLISNLIGILLSNGFDIDQGRNANTTTWARLSRKDRDRVQREFDVAAGQHKLQYRFTIP